MLSLNPAEVTLLNEMSNPDLIATLNDIKNCAYYDLERQFKKQHAIILEGLLGFPMPPPPCSCLQRQQRQHYKKQEVWSRVCSLMEAYPSLRSSTMEHLMAKLQYVTNNIGPAGR
jgi:hypothetical protein